MVLSQLQLAYLYYLELSLTVLQNYRLESLIKSFEAPSGKTTIKKYIYIYKSLRNHHRYICWYIIGWVYQDSRLPRPLASNVTANLKCYLQKYSVENKIKYFQLLLKKSNFYSSRKQSMVPLDKGLQRVNVKQKPLRQI